MNDMNVKNILRGYLGSESLEIKESEKSDIETQSKYFSKILHRTRENRIFE